MREFEDLFVILPSFVIGLFSLYLGIYESIERYLISDRFKRLNPEVRKKRKAVLTKLLNIRIHFNIICGIFLLLSLIFWLCIYFRSESS